MFYSPLSLVVDPLVSPSRHIFFFSVKTKTTVTARAQVSPKRDKVERVVRRSKAAKQWGMTWVWTLSQCWQGSLSPGFLDLTVVTMKVPLKFAPSKAHLHPREPVRNAESRSLPDLQDQNLPFLEIPSDSKHIYIWEAQICIKHLYILHSHA